MMCRSGEVQQGIVEWMQWGSCKTCKTVCTFCNQRLATSVELSFKLCLFLHLAFVCQEWQSLTLIITLGYSSQQCCCRQHHLSKVATEDLHFVKRVVSFNWFSVTVIKCLGNLCSPHFSKVRPKMPLKIEVNPVFFNLIDWSKTHKRLKERFLKRWNRTKRANFRCNPLFQATYNTTENS